MSYLTDLFIRPPKATTGSTVLPLTDTAAWGLGTASGATVTPETALRVSTVWACVRLLSDCIGMLPLIMYERLPNGDRERATAHPLYDVLHTQTNYRQTAYQYRKMMMAHLLLRGRAYSVIVPGPRGFADQLIPLHPDKTFTEEMPDGRLRYVHYANSGERRVYTDDEIFHLRGLSLNGVDGVGVIEYARETVGLSIAREQYGARFFNNDSTPGGILKTAGKLSPEGSARMKASWRAAHGAGRSPHTVAVLEEGLEYQAIGVTNKDSQFIELGEATAEQIAGQWFGVPPHMVGLTTKSTSWGSGLEEMGQGFVTYTLMPWMTEWEQAITRDLILAPQKYFAEFLTDALLKGRLLDRYNAYQIAKNIGLMSPNEMRRRENMNRRTDPGGDAYQDVPAGAPAPAAGADIDAPTHADTHYMRLLYENARRVIRKETAAMGKAAKRRETFSAAIAEFYADHAEFVAAAMQVPVTTAAAYVAEQTRELAERGPEAMADWETRRVEALVQFALKGE